MHLQSSQAAPKRLEQIHGSFLSLAFMQGQLQGTPKFLKAIDEVFIGCTMHTSGTVKKRQYQLLL